MINRRDRGASVTDRYEIAELWRENNKLNARVVELEGQVKELQLLVSASAPKPPPDRSWVHRRVKFTNKDY